MNNIALDLLSVDQDRQYEVDLKDFMRVIERRSKIPQYLKEESTDILHEYIGEYTDQNGKVDYRSMVEELRNFNYEDANQKLTYGANMNQSQGQGQGHG